MSQERILPALDDRAHERWVELSRRTRAAAIGLSPSAINDELEYEANREPESPTAPAFRLWVADNLAREARYAESVPAFDLAIESCEGAPLLVEGVDLVGVAMHHKAQAAAHAAQLDVSVRTFQELARRIAHPESPLFEAGHVLDMAGRLSEAGEQYRAASSASHKGSGDATAVRAERALERLVDSRGRFFPGVAKLAEHVRAAVRVHPGHGYSSVRPKG